jgi:hypothetical protein
MALRARSDEPRHSPAALAAAIAPPAGLRVALLRPHDHEGPDGLRGGTPHLHGVVTEGYLAVSGHGQLHVIDREGPATHELAPGVLIWCAPGTVARLVDSGDLVVALLVEQGGLDDVVVPGVARGDDAGLDMHRAAVTAMLALAEALRERDIEGYVALHRAVPQQLARVVEHGEVTGAVDDGASKLAHRLERLAADDAHHLLDAVAAAAGASVPACASLVGMPVDG